MDKYKGFTLVTNEHGRFEAYRHDLDFYLFAKDKRQIIIEINDWLDYEEWRSTL